jgi:hypothetical protein
MTVVPKSGSTCANPRLTTGTYRLVNNTFEFTISIADVNAALKRACLPTVDNKGAFTAPGWEVDLQSRQSHYVAAVQDVLGTPPATYQGTS